MTKEDLRKNYEEFRKNRSVELPFVYYEGWLEDTILEIHKLLLQAKNNKIRGII